MRVKVPETFAPPDPAAPVCPAADVIHRCLCRELARRVEGGKAVKGTAGAAPCDLAPRTERFMESPDLDLPVGDTSSRARIRQEEKFAMAGVVARCIAHDMGNIVERVIGGANVVKMIESGRRIPGKELERSLAALAYGARLTAARCRDFLGFDEEEKAGRVNIHVLLCSTARECREVLGERVEINVHSTLENVIIRCQRSKIERILWNLFDNAYKAILRDESKTVTIDVSLEESDGEIGIVVCDDIEGGMPEDDLARFTQLRDKLTSVGSDDYETLRILAERMNDAELREKQGYGIGSFFTCLTIREMGGSIEVESGRNGTCFTIRIPLGGDDTASVGEG